MRYNKNKKVMSIKKLFKKKSIKVSATLVLLIILVVSIFDFLGSSPQVYSATPSPDIPTSSKWNVFKFFGNASFSLGGITICQFSSGKVNTSNCSPSPTSNLFNPVGPGPNNTYIYEAPQFNVDTSLAQSNLYITVPNTQPTGNIVNGQFRVGGSSKTYNISISNYSSALSKAQQNCAVLQNDKPPIPCANPNGILGQKVTNTNPVRVIVTADVTDSGAVGQTIGPIEFDLLDSNKNQIQSVQSGTSKVTISKYGLDDANFSASFTNVSPGLYYINSPNVNTPAQMISVPSTTSVTLSGTYVNNGGGGGSSVSSQPTCESSNFPLAWLTCAVINEIGSMESALENVIGQLLTTQPLVYNSSGCSNNSSQSTQSCIFKVWNNFRIIANVLLVVAIIVVVFAESIGGGLIDAYSIRKILPRILISAILINLSIYVVGALMDITNILGKGIFDLIKAPFGSAGHWSINPNGTASTMFSLGFLALISVGALSIWSTIKKRGGSGAKSLLDAAVGIAFLVGLPVILSIIGIVITIIFRIGIIYFLVMISPIAFALYVLPNTENYFKKWWKVLIEALMVYPIVMIVFAMADVTGIVVSGLSSGLPGYLSWISSLLGIAATVSPLFLIPYSFKLAGNTIGSVHDLVTKHRSNLHNAIKGDIKNPSSLRNRMSRKLGNATNELGISRTQLGATFNPKYLRKGGMAMRRGEIEARRSGGRSIFGTQEFENSQVFQHYKNDEKFLTALYDRDWANQNMEAETDPMAKAAWQQAISAASTLPYTASSRLTAGNALAATGFNFKYGKDGYNQLALSTIKALGGSKDDLEMDNVSGTYKLKNVEKYGSQYSQAMNNAQYALRTQGQRFDLGGINNGKGYDYDAGVSKASGYVAGNAKKEVFQAGAESKLGIVQGLVEKDKDGNPKIVSYNDQLVTALSSGKVKKEDVQKYMEFLGDAFASPTQGNKDEIKKQMDTIEYAADISGLGLDSAEIERIKAVAERRVVDPNNTFHSGNNK